MRIQRHLAIAAAMVVCAAGTAAAQNSGKVGITMGHPASFGVLWHASDKIAIRPELTLSGSSSETNSSSFNTDSDGWAIGTGVSLLVYLKKFDNVQTYFTPRFTYGRATTSGESAALIATTVLTNTSTESTTTGVGGSGSFGAQASLGSKFAVFGELGFGFNHTSNKLNLPLPRSTANSWGTRSGVGVIFYP